MDVYGRHIYVLHSWINLRIEAKMINKCWLKGRFEGDPVR
jgi:hypothetical protein